MVGGSIPVTQNLSIVSPELVLPGSQRSSKGIQLPSVINSSETINSINFHRNPTELVAVTHAIIRDHERTAQQNLFNTFFLPRPFLHKSPVLQSAIL